MSSEIYPALTGLGFGVKRNYVWKSGVQEALSGKQSAISYRQYPLVHYELTYNLLDRTASPDDLQAIIGLFNQMKGRFDTFLFTDPDFNTIGGGGWTADSDSVTADSSVTVDAGSQPGQYGVFGIGDGTTVAFQLVATFQNYGGPGQPEIIQNLNGTPVLYDNGTAIPAANYIVGPTGIVTFGTAPTSGHVLTWSGSWYYRCRFDEDAIVWTKFLANYWKAVTKFTSVKLALALFALSPLLSVLRR